MIDQLSTLIIAATSLRADVSQDAFEFLDSEGLSIDLGEGIENSALIFEYLLQQYKPTSTVTESVIKSESSTNIQSPLINLKEENLVIPNGRELPVNGNRFPLEKFTGADSKLLALSVQESKEISAVIEPAATSLTGLNRGTGVLEIPNYVLDLQSGQANVERPLSNRVVWMANQNLQAAELRVNPPQLGPVEIRVSVEGDQTNVSLIAQHSAVREIMESAIPRLRDLLAESGLNLANIDVSQHDLSQRRHDTPRFLSAWQEEIDPLENLVKANSELENQQSNSIGSGLIDFYA